MVLVNRCHSQVYTRQDHVENRNWHRGSECVLNICGTSCVWNGVVCKRFFNCIFTPIKSISPILLTGTCRVNQSIKKETLMVFRRWSYRERLGKLFSFSILFTGFRWKWKVHGLLHSTTKTTITTFVKGPILAPCCCCCHVVIRLLSRPVDFWDFSLYLIATSPVIVNLFWSEPGSCMHDGMPWTISARVCRRGSPIFTEFSYQLCR